MAGNPNAGSTKRKHAAGSEKHLRLLEESEIRIKISRNRADTAGKNASICHPSRRFLETWAVRFLGGDSATGEFANCAAGSGVIRILVAATQFQIVFDFVDEILQIIELAVDAGKTDISDLIQADQKLHGHLADLVAFDLAVVVGHDLAFDRSGQLFNLFLGNGAFPAGTHDPTHDLFAAEGFALLILFDNGDLKIGQAFKSGVAASTFIAVSSATDDKPVFVDTAVDDFIVVFSAERAAHGDFRQEFMEPNFARKTAINRKVIRIKDVSQAAEGRVASWAWAKARRIGRVCLIHGPII